MRFTPFADSPRRVIDFLSIGGRSEAVHESLLRFAAGRGLFYVHDTVPSALMKPMNATQHRELLANCAKRSRFFLVNHAKFGSPEKDGQSEVGARYFEGAAAGTVLLGRAPDVHTFREDFPWPDAVINVNDDGTDVEAVLDGFAGTGKDLERIGVRNAVHALRRHDWGHRWTVVLQQAGMTPRPALTARLLALEGLAANAEGLQDAGGARPRW
jgi:hypothetical protein